MTTITAHDLREGRSLVDPALFQKLTERVATEHDHDLGMAARIVDQALAFLGTTATHQGRPLSPSDEVDPGWHEFILHQLNLLVDSDQVHVIDWAWSRTGPPWVDAALLTARLIGEGHEPAQAEHLVSGTWGMQHSSARPEAVTAFAATTYGQWRRLAVEFPSPHREAALRGARKWTRHRLPAS